MINLLHGDCLEQMKTLDDSSVDSIVSDPPYGISFMAKKWDYDVPSVEVWEEAMRVLKPGGHALIACGTRTQHRMVVNIEDAGFEIRDVVSWIYGSGFPKSLNVSKQIDKEEQNKWKNISKALDSHDIMGVWKKYLTSANAADRILEKSQTEVGTNTQKRSSAHVHVHPSISLERLNVAAVIAELSSTGACLTSVNSPTAQRSAEVKQKLKHLSVKSAEIRSSDQTANAWGIIPIARVNAKDSLSERTESRTKVEEALKTWLGKRKSTSEEATNALCAAMVVDLKLIILNQSKTFQSLDTTSQMECVSAISVTITESTAEHLISSMVDTLKSKAIDKAAGAEREVVGFDASKARPNKDGYAKVTSSCDGGGNDGHKDNGATITAPATEAAKQWDGWGTALKPSCEFFTLCRKPLSEKTIAANVLKWGTGGINIDGCRVETDEAINYGTGKKSNVGFKSSAQNNDRPIYDGKGRFPANLIHSGEQEVLELFPETKSAGKTRAGGEADQDGKGGLLGVGNHQGNGMRYGDNGGSAARFFYCAKASKKDRNEGNTHPTVKPTALMSYLCRLITPTGGVVLDPYMGSGSTGKAAIREGFSFVGCELDKDYFDIATARVTNEES